MEGLDILGCAQTGTGKTAAFALPILDYLGREQPPLQSNRPTALVLAPTRELAQQISDSFRTYGKHMRFRHAVVYGGVGQAAQTKALGRGLDVLIATPGRLIDLMDQGFVDLGETEILVLDDHYSKAMAHLTDQEQLVIRHRFGIAGGAQMTLKEIGELMNISRERVRQIECQAKDRLRKMFARRRMVKAPDKRMRSAPGRPGDTPTFPPNGRPTTR